MLMKLIILLMFTFTLLGAHAQHGTSSMFNETGQLRADTSLWISQDQLERWISVEYLLLAHLVKNVRYSDMATDGRVNGRMVCSFEVDKEGGVSGFDLVSGPGYGMDQVLKRALGSFQFISKLSDGITSSGLFYVVLDLQHVDARSHLREHGAIPIIGVNTSVIQH
jgi:hypothetical protein